MNVYFTGVVTIGIITALITCFYSRKWAPTIVINKDITPKTWVKNWCYFTPKSVELLTYNPIFNRFFVATLRYVAILLSPVGRNDVFHPHLGSRPPHHDVKPRHDSLPGNPAGKSRVQSNGVLGGWAPRYSFTLIYMAYLGGIPPNHGFTQLIRYLHVRWKTRVSHDFRIPFTNQPGFHSFLGGWAPRYREWLITMVIVVVGSDVGFRRVRNVLKTPLFTWFCAATCILYWCPQYFVNVAFFTAICSVFRRCSKKTRNRPTLPHILQGVFYRKNEMDCLGTCFTHAQT